MYELSGEIHVCQKYGSFSIIIMLLGWSLSFCWNFFLFLMRLRNWLSVAMITHHIGAGHSGVNRNIPESKSDLAFDCRGAGLWFPTLSDVWRAAAV